MRWLFMILLALWLYLCRSPIFSPHGSEMSIQANPMACGRLVSKVIRRPTKRFGNAHWLALARTLHAREERLSMAQCCSMDQMVCELWRLICWHGLNAIWEHCHTLAGKCRHNVAWIAPSSCAEGSLKRPPSVGKSARSTASSNRRQPPMSVPCYQNCSNVLLSMKKVSSPRSDKSVRQDDSILKFNKPARLTASQALLDSE